MDASWPLQICEACPLQRSHRPKHAPQNACGGADARRKGAEMFKSITPALHTGLGKRLKKCMHIYNCTKAQSKADSINRRACASACARCGRPLVARGLCTKTKYLQQSCTLKTS